MTSEKRFSALLKGKRTELELTQDQMAPLLGMKLRMYQLYERGDYDGKSSIRREKYLRKLATLQSNNTQVDYEDVKDVHIMHLKNQIEMLKQINELQAQLIVHQRMLLRKSNRLMAPTQKVRHT